MKKFEKWLLPLAAVLITALALAPTLFNGWTNWDDGLYVLENPLFASGVPGNFFSQNYIGNYQPLTLLSLWVDWLIAGDNAAWYHAVNLAWHLATVLLVYALALTLIGNKPGAFLVAVLFGIHPMHVESVAWISGRKDLLYGFFFVAAMLGWQHWLKGKRRLQLGVAQLCFVAAILSKAMAIVLPVVLLLQTFAAEQRVPRSAWLALVPFGALSVVFGVVAFTAQQDADAVSALADVPLLHRLLAACYALCFYAAECIAPIKLSPYHPWPTEPGSIPWYFYVSALVVAAGLAVTAFFAKRKPWLLFGVGVLVAVLLPVSQLIPIGHAFVAERYTYVAYLGPLLMLGAWLNTRPVKFWLLLVPVFALLSFRYAHTWESSETLWSKAIDAYPSDFYAYGQRAGWHVSQGNFDAALADYDRAIERNNRFAKLYNNRGKLHMDAGNAQQAVADFSNAIKLDANLVEAHTNIGLLHLRANNLVAAEQALNRALAVQPFAFAYLNRALVYQRTNRTQQALADVDAALQLMPGFEPALRMRQELQTTLQQQ